MRVTLLVLLALMLPQIAFVGNCLAKSNEDMASDTYAQKGGAASSKPSRNPLRSICAIEWNAYYKSRNIEIEVSTRGADNESVVFTCNLCSLEDHFIEPFLYTEYEGKKGIDRVKECGFKQVVFRGGRGINEIVIDVPDGAKP